VSWTTARAGTLVGVIVLAQLAAQGCSLFAEETTDARVPSDAIMADLSDTSQESVPLPDSTRFPAELELYLDFDTLTNGSFPDRSGNDRSVALASGARFSTDGRYDGAVELSGAAGQALDLGSVLDGLPRLTIEVWVRSSTTLAGWNAIVSNFGVADGYWLGSALGIDGVAEWRVLSTAVVSSRPAFDGRWHHLAATYDARSTPPVLEIFVDGLADVRGQLAGSRVPSAPDFDLLVGAGGVGRRPFVGLIDELKIWSVVRTEEQICSDSGRRYVGGFSPACE
jgi:hypothetical protein